MNFLLFILLMFYPTVLCPIAKAASGTSAVCSGNGRCMSLRDSAGYADYELNLGQVSYTGWDADMVHGCVCDDGWEGSSCSRRSCPKGDDPYTVDQVPEVQVLECTCSDDCSGTFRLAFEGKKTSKIPLNASAEVVKFRLEVISLVFNTAIYSFILLVVSAIKRRRHGQCEYKPSNHDMQ